MIGKPHLDFHMSDGTARTYSFVKPHDVALAKLPYKYEFDTTLHTTISCEIQPCFPTSCACLKYVILTYNNRTRFLLSLLGANVLLSACLLLLVNTNNHCTNAFTFLAARLFATSLAGVTQPTQQTFAILGLASPLNLLHI